MIFFVLRPSKINSAVRPSAQSRISTATSGNVRPSTSNARPSARISSATPLRTPKTPVRSQSRDRNTFVPMTAEKEKAPTDDREIIQTYSMKILNELAEIGGFNDLVQKGFKAMTVKQFNAILLYFLQKIYRNPNLEKVHDYLLELEYPYNFPKSSLKTPNAPHCLNSVIVLLSWLQDFTRFEVEPTFYVATEEIPNEEMTKKIMEKTSEMFTIWNNGQIEIDQAAENVNEFYRDLIGVGQSNITTDINSLKDEINHLKKGMKPHSLAAELSDKNQNLNSLNQKITMQQENIKELLRKKENANAELALKRNAERSTYEELQRLQNQLSNQKITMDARHSLLIEITQMKSALVSKKNAVMELRETSSENEIILSNLISKKCQLIDRFNNLIYKMSSDMEIAGLGDAFDPDEFAINTKNDDEMEKMLDRISHGMKKIKEIYLSTLSAYKQKLQQFEHESHQLKTESDLQLSKLTQLRSTLEQLTIEEKNLELECSSFLHNTQTEHQTHKEQLECIEREIEERTKGIEQLSLDVEEMMEKRKVFSEKSYSECEKLFQERKSEIEQHRKTLEENNAIINNYHKNKKPLPENLQKTLDGILKKRAAAENKENSTNE